MNYPGVLFLIRNDHSRLDPQYLTLLVFYLKVCLNKNFLLRLALKIMKAFVMEVIIVKTIKMLNNNGRKHLKIIYHCVSISF